MISSSLYQRIEFTFPAPADLAGLNPFDTRDICLRGVMTDPRGTHREVYGFADRDHRPDPVPSDPKAIERAVATGPLVFRARVSANAAGSHFRELDPPGDLKVPTTLSGSDFYGQFIPMVWGGGNNTNGIVSDAGAPVGDPVVEIRLDGRVALRRPVVVTKPKGTTDLYCDRLAIDVPEGRHEIEICNVGQGLFITGHLLLTNYQTRSQRYSAQGLRCGDRCAFWIYNRDYQWETSKAGRAVEPIKDADILLRGLTPGAYDLQWWGTLAGQVTQCERVSVGHDGVLKVCVPVFLNDIAGKLLPMR